MANINGTNGNDTLLGTVSADTINGKAGNDTIAGKDNNDTLTGGGGKDTFIYNFDDSTDTITDFGGVGQGTNPTAAVIAEVDTIKFQGAGLTARNLLLTQNGSNLEIFFEGLYSTIIILKNFKLEDLDNLKASGTRPAIGNIIFAGQNSITDSFNVLDANSTETSIGIKNTVTFLNDLANNITGLDDSNDVVNGQGGNDKIDGKSGNDLLRGGTGNDTLIGGAGNDTLIGDIDSKLFNVNYLESYNGDNLLASGDGNDSLFIYRSSGKNTLNGGAGDDTLRLDYSNNDNLLDGDDGNDFLSVVSDYTSGYGEEPSSDKNTLNGGAGDDYLSISNSSASNLLFGGDGNDSLFASDNYGNNTLNGGFGDDTLNPGYEDDILAGGGGKDKFVFDYLSYGNVNTIIDFGGVGKRTNPTAEVIAEVDTLIFQGAGLSAQNLLLSQNGNNLEISFEVLFGNPKLILQNFALENLDNLSKSTGATVDLGNILFYEQTSITDSFDVFDANSIQSNIFNKNTVTFLNDLNNNVKGFDNSDDVINGQGGDDILDGKSGNDWLRGGIGNNTLNGGIGDDYLNVDFTAGNNLLSGGYGNDSLFASGYQYDSSFFDKSDDLRSLGNNTLKGGAGNDSLSASGSTGDNLLSGDDGNDFLSASGMQSTPGGDFFFLNDSRSSGNNTLKGGAGNDSLSASGSIGDNLLFGGDGSDSLSISGYYEANYDSGYDSRSSGNNLLDGGDGDDNLSAAGSAGNNLLFGGNGNDSLSLFVDLEANYDSYYDFRSSGNNTLDGGAGDDILRADYSDGDNLLSGGDGNDSLSISGYYQGIDSDSRSFGNNTLNGGAGNDTLSVENSTGDNLLSGGDGNDILTAINATGKNTLKGGNGNDTLTGGSGIDTFGFNSFNEGVDRIIDFNAINEVIRVSSAGFGGGLSAGVLSANQFRIGASATTSSQRFIYNSTTGALFFDRDGNAGAFAQVQFGQLSTGLSLTNNNFVIV